jgi:prepilin-type processing-associated H-X9-DG protein
LGFFPTGGWDWTNPPTYVRGQPAVGQTQQAGWGFQILPYIEGTSAWYGSGATDDLGRILIAVGAPNPVFFCPSRRAPVTRPFSDPEYLNGRAVTVALCDYAASNLDNSGVVQHFLPTRILEITDGTSNTLLAGDKRLNVGRLDGPQKDDDTGYTTGWDEDTMRVTEQPPKPDFADPTGGDGDQRFGSSHPARFNAVFADGSVHTIAYDINRLIFEYLGDKSDGNVVNPNDL